MFWFGARSKPRQSTRFWLITAPAPPQVLAAEEGDFAADQGRRLETALRVKVEAAIDHELACSYDVPSARGPCEP